MAARASDGPENEAGGCVKFAYPTRVSADRMARLHDRQRRTRACDSCRAGLRIEAYACTYGDHWHIGHNSPAKRRALEQEAASRRLNMLGIGY